MTKMATSSIPAMAPSAPSGGIPSMGDVPDEPQVLEGEHAQAAPTTLKEVFEGLFGYGKDKPTRGQQGARNVVSAVDMALSIPAMVVGSGIDALTRAARSAEDIQSHEQIAAAANKNYDAIMSQVGSPLHKVLKWAGIGSDSEEDQSPIDKMMGRAEELITTGGGKVQETTGGIVTTDDVKSLVHAAMALGGAKGMKAGLAKLVAKNPSLALDAVQDSPEAEQAKARAFARASNDPLAPGKMAATTADAAEKAADAKVRIVDPTLLKLDPLTGDLREAIPEMGKALPKPSSAERALEKVSNGRRFDLTAEERVALKGLEDKPLDQPIIGENGQILSGELAHRPLRNRQQLQEIADSLGLVVDSAASGFRSGKGFITIPSEDAVMQGGVHPNEIFAHELGHAVLQKRGMSYKGFPRAELIKQIPNYTEMLKASQEFRPSIWKHSEPKIRKYAARPEEVLADTVGAVLLGKQPKSLIQPWMDKIGLTDSDLGLVKRTSRARQSGFIDPKLMARLAAVGLGAWAGNYFSDDHDFDSALLGAGAGLAATAIPYRSAANLAKFLLSEDKRLRINDIADAQEKYTRMEAVEVRAQQKQIEKLVPKTEDRSAITHAIEAGDLSKLTKEQQQAAKIAIDYFSAKGGEASLEGVLKSARDNYVTHIWDWSKNKGLFERWMERGTGQPGMGTYNRFGDERTIPTIAAGKAAGLTPLTEDVSVIMGIYGNSMSRSIANSVFTRALKEEVIPGTNQRLVMPTDEAPHSYVPINNPNMAGLRVHPDIAPSLKMLYDTSSPGAAMKIMQGISDTSKRVAVSFSLFHAKALTDAMIGGSSNPFRAVSKIPGFVAGTDRYLKELDKGSASPLVERALEGGLKFSLEGEGAGVEDAGASFYGAMSAVQGALDKIVPHGGAPIKAIEWVNHKVDTLMWARLHAGMKLNLFAEKYQQLLDNAAKKGIQLDPDQAARIAASYTNDLFGGLNWRRVAEDAKTRFGRELGQAMLNPGARRVMGLLWFAPDWTISTTRAAVKAFGRPDFLRPTTLAGLHQQYLLRSAAYYLIVGDAINYQMSGHHLWENKDPTVLDMDPKGERHMQWSKHTMEPVHWITKPGQQALNKLGVIPREAAAQVLDVEYLSAKGRMPKMENRARHLAQNFLPISAQQADQGGAASLVSGFAGVPIYGKTAEQKKKEREERARKKKKK